jgi:large subunit ribosomal protein L4
MSSVTIESSGAGRRGRERPEPERRTVRRRRTDGTVVDEVVLDPQIFGIEPNEAVLHQVVTAQLAAARSGTQSTKTRSEVAGGGAKPYRQKGTGRSRQGSIRSPQWVGGGIALGPKPRKYRQRTPKKMVRLALLSALSDRAAEDRVALVDEWSFEVPKTKDAVAALEVLGIEGRVLVVLGPYDGVADRSFANLPRVQTVQSAELNAYDVVRSDWVVFSTETLIGEVEVAEASVSTPDELDAEASDDGDETADVETAADVEANAEDETGGELEGSEDSEEAGDEEDSK